MKNIIINDKKTNTIIISIFGKYKFKYSETLVFFIYIKINIPAIPNKEEILDIVPKLLYAKVSYAKLVESIFSGFIIIKTKDWIKVKTKNISNEIISVSDRFQYFEFIFF